MKSAKVHTSKKQRERIYIVPTRYGVLYGAAVGILLIVATVFNHNGLFFASSLLVTFGLICMQQTHFNVRSVSIISLEPSSGYSGESVPWKIRISNSSIGDAYSINIRDAIVDVPARETLVENIVVGLRKRGRVHLRELKISSTYPLGLFYAWKWWEGDVHYYVYPPLKGKPQILRHLGRSKNDLDSREDFLGHRLFVSGDSAHHIDWKVHARRQKFYVKLFDTHDTEVVHLDWNGVPVPGVEEKLSYLATAIHECEKLQRPFSLRLPHVDVAAGQSRAHRRRCLQILAAYGAPDEVA